MLGAGLEIKLKGSGCFKTAIYSVIVLNMVTAPVLKLLRALSLLARALSLLLNSIGRLDLTT